MLFPCQVTRREEILINEITGCHLSRKKGIRVLKSKGVGHSLLFLKCMFRNGNCVWVILSVLHLGSLAEGSSIFLSHIKEKRGRLRTIRSTLKEAILSACFLNILEH